MISVVYYLREFEFDLNTFDSFILLISFDILLSFLFVIGRLRVALYSLLLYEVIVSPVRFLGGLVLIKAPELAIVLPRLYILVFSVPLDILLFNMPAL